jgi:fumarylacetoacetate (FAA) hydrolase
MKLVTYRAPASPGTAQADRAGVLLGERVLDLAALGAWAAREHVASPQFALPDTMAALLRLGAEGMAASRAAFDAAATARAEDLAAHAGLAYALGDVRLRTPVPEPPTIRDFYAFEQHVKAARTKRGLEMIPEWYEAPVFYYSNTSALYGTGEEIPYPRHSDQVDFELEMAAVMGREGREIAAEDAPAYIAGYLVMNDWSARDIWWRYEAKLSMGPAKAKDFATSLGPYLVTPDELEDRRVGSGKDERFDLAMAGRINGDQLSNANFKDITFTFPQMIERASQDVRLRPGDILGSGTCGTGCILELGTERHRWLEPGDVVEMEIERLGVLRNIIAPRPTGKEGHA